VERQILDDKSQLRRHWVVIASVVNSFAQLTEIRQWMAASAVSLVPGAEPGIGAECGKISAHSYLERDKEAGWRALTVSRPSLRCVHG